MRVKRCAALVVLIASFAFPAALAQDKALPALPAATSPAEVVSQREAVLSFLTKLSAGGPHRILSGQWFSGPSWPKASELFGKKLEQQTGESVAIYASNYDIHAPSKTPLASPPLASPESLHALDDVLIHHWKAGGLVSLTWTPDNPWRRLGVGHTCGEVPKPCAPGSFSDLQRTDNPAGAYFKLEMDDMAERLKTLQDAGVIVMFRPFHEMNGEWFWWGSVSADKPGQAEFVGLWRFVHDYFIHEKGLDNILWVYSPNNSNVATTKYSWGVIKPTTLYYPGGPYVDVVGVDYYEDRLGPPASGTAASDNSIPTYRQLTALGKPFGLAELGPKVGSNRDFDFDAVAHELAKDYPRAAFFTAWQDNPAAGKYLSIISNPDPSKLMHDPLVLTREDLRH